MKVILITFVSSLISLFAWGQNVTLDQVISLRVKSIAEVEEFLTTRNWQLTKATQPGDSTMGIATFAFDKSNYDDKAISFITYCYNFSPSTNRINIEITKIQTYNVFISRLKTLGYKLTSSKIDDGQIVKIYSGKNIIIEVRSATHKEGFTTKTNYLFFICDSFDYLFNWKK